MNRPDRLTCEETFARLDDYLDRALAAEEVALVRSHLDTCAVCASEYRFEESLLTEIRRKVEGLEVPDDFKRRLAALLAEAGEPEA